MKQLLQQDTKEHESLQGKKDYLKMLLANQQEKKDSISQGECTSNPYFKPTPNAVSPTPISSTSFLVYPKGVCSTKTESYMSWLLILNANASPTKLYHTEKKQ